MFLLGVHLILLYFFKIWEKSAKSFSYVSNEFSYIIRNSCLSPKLECAKAQYRTCKTSRGHFASLVVSKKCLLPMKILIFYFKTSRGHFTSLVVLKKVPATYGDFDFFFSKYPRFSNLKLDFFSAKKEFFADFPKLSKFFPSKLYF